VYLLIVQENDELLLFFKGLLLLLLLKYKLLLLLMLLQFVAGVILIAPFEFLTRSNKSEADGIVDFATFEPNCIGNGDDDKDDDADADEHNDDWDGEGDGVEVRVNNFVANVDIVVNVVGVGDDDDVWLWVNFIADIVGDEILTNAGVGKMGFGDILVVACVAVDIGMGIGNAGTNGGGVVDVAIILPPAVIFPLLVIGFGCLLLYGFAKADGLAAIGVADVFGDDIVTSGGGCVLDIE